MAKAARSVRVIVPPLAIVLTLRPGAVDRERKSDGETRQGVATRSVRTTVFTLEDPCSCHAAMNSPRGVTATSGPRGRGLYGLGEDPFGAESPSVGRRSHQHSVAHRCRLLPDHDRPTIARVEWLGACRPHSLARRAEAAWRALKYPSVGMTC